MQVVVDTAPPVFNHFLMKGTEVTVKSTDGRTTAEEKMVRVANDFRWDLADEMISIDIVLSTVFSYNGKDYRLLKISQRFNVRKENNRAVGLVPTQWQKMRPDQSAGITKIIPPLHPLLQVNGGTITASAEFADITQLFNDIHSDTPWFSAFELLRGTNRIVKVLAALHGHPFVWYVVVPESVSAKQDLQPNLLYYPADYGGISYPSDNIDGIKTPNHDTSVANIQCGGETLFSFLTKPISDAEYDDKLEKYLALLRRFSKRAGRNPPPLHHFREVLSYNPSISNIEPQYWDIPFGFEQALSEKQQILLIPQINNADGGTAIREGLKKLVENAIFLIYTNGYTLTYDTITVTKLTLICYSQSGGNVFTSANKNRADIKALVCFEPQYMNQHLKGEDTSLTLGKDVIPLLLRQGAKVAIVGRRKHGWESKYLPLKVNAADLILLPDDAHYSVLDYPDASTPYDPSGSPVLTRRYSRLLKPAADPVVDSMLSKESGTIDFASAIVEARVDEIIQKYRKAGLNDEKVVKAVFTPSYNADISGGYYTHNFIVSCGQEMTADGQYMLKFFQQALNLIG